ncbi:MAG: ATP-binding protein [Succinivibrio sp.]
MFYRHLYNHLINWKNNPNKVALCIFGARQVGKTTLVRNFAAEHYKTFIELNFALEPELKKCFEHSLSADSIISNLTAFFAKEFPVHKTLIFLDEIQECPNARTAIKSLVEDGRFDYIESGSLLGARVKEVPSLPVGFEEQLTMYPLDLEEYALALGVDRKIIERLKESFDSRTSVNPVLHETFLKIFYSYMVVGGMPAVVDEYIRSKDIAKVLNVQRQIIAMYRQDISKYAYTGKDRIHAIFDAIPSELEAKNRRFVLTDLNKHARMTRFENSFLWLNDAGVANPCFNVTQCTQPLKLNEKRNVFKLFLSDTGLLGGCCEDNIQFPLFNGDMGVNLGGILENMVAQQLKANGFTLHYYDSLKIGEIDFVIEKDSRIIPIEVKSGKDYKRHRALDKLLEIDEWQLNQAYVLCGSNIEVNGKITYLPWYMLMFIKQTAVPQNSIMDIDLSILEKI